MNVSYSIVRRLYSEASSTALRPCGGCQNRLTPKDKPPLSRKVRSGAVNNASQLKKPLNLNLIILVIRNIPKKERSKSVDKMKSPFLFKAQGAPTWIQTVSICKPPIRP